MNATTMNALSYIAMACFLIGWWGNFNKRWSDPVSVPRWRWWVLVFGGALFVSLDLWRLLHWLAWV